MTYDLNEIRQKYLRLMEIHRVHDSLEERQELRVWLLNAIPYLLGRIEGKDQTSHDAYGRPIE